MWGNLQRKWRWKTEKRLLFLVAMANIALHVFPVVSWYILYVKKYGTQASRSSWIANRTTYYFQYASHFLLHFTLGLSACNILITSLLSATVALEGIHKDNLPCELAKLSGWETGNSAEYFSLDIQYMVVAASECSLCASYMYQNYISSKNTFTAKTMQV